MPSQDEHFIEDDERERLLEAIEQQAKSRSIARGSDEHRLSDWLNAAEEVMPEIKKPTVKPMSLSQAPTPSNNTNTLLGYVLAGTVALSLAGGGTFAYMQLNEEVNNLKQANQKLTDSLDSTNKKLAELEKNQTPESKPTDAMTHSNASEAGSVAPKGDELTQKLQEQTQQLQGIIDTRMKQLLESLEQQKQGIKTQSVTPITTNATAQNLHEPTQPAVAIPNAPAAVEMTPATSAPTATENTNEDAAVTWLKGLSAEHLILQLGSNIKSDGLHAMIKKMHHNPEMAHVLPIKVNGSTRYVLVYGGFANREMAKEASDLLKNDLGISPWVRRAGDVQKLLH